MKVKANNYLVDIIANMKKDGDYAKSLKIAEIMVERSEGDLVMVEADEHEGYIVLSSLGGYKHREELLEMYKDAQAAA